MEAHLSLRRIKNTLNEYLSNKEGKRIRVFLLTNSMFRNFDHKNPGEAILSRDKRVLKATYFKKEKILGKNTRVYVEVFQDEIEQIIKESLTNWKVIEIDLTYPDDSVEPNGIDLILEKKKEQVRALK